MNSATWWDRLPNAYSNRPGPEVINFFFMLNSTSDVDSPEHEISTAHKN